MAVYDREQSDSYSGVAGPIFCGAGAVVVGMLGVFWVGLAGLVWRPWEFGSTYHWNDEGPFALRIALIFFAIAAGLVLWIIARGAWT
ncbi:hypothetical protein [Microbacterium sp. USHLN272]|uniref:hypothetical protein n=1 Tax=Microbacterium sp. USHLN272 TaxID=3081287 RepID=UPI003017823C